MAIGNCEYAGAAYNGGQEAQSRTRAHACRAAVEETTTAPDPRRRDKQDLLTASPRKEMATNIILETSMVSCPSKKKPPVE